MPLTSRSQHCTPAAWMMLLLYYQVSSVPNPVPGQVRFKQALPD
jgi:hypothetical protein